MPSRPRIRTSSFVSSTLAANGNLNAAYSVGAVIGEGAMGAYQSTGVSGQQTYTDSVNWTINATSLTGHWVLGLIGNQTLGSGIVGFGLTVKVDGSNVYTAPSFTTLADAQSYFTDDAIDLGSLSQASNQTVTVSFSVTTAGASDGFGFDFLLGSGEAPCYCRGTRILTDEGEIAVEDLREGDLVVTASGELRPIRWIGRRRLRPDRCLRPEAVRPVRIAAGALRPGVPARALFVSPEHALWLDEAWIAAKDLVNGATIRQEAWREVEYFHVELDSHDILLAEGAPAESYLDCGNRRGFQNAVGEAVALDPDWTPAEDPRRFASLAATARLRERLARRAADLGRGAELAAHGAWLAARANAPRINWVRNPRGMGASLGAIGAGGAAPWHWWYDSPKGVGVEIVAQGVEAGLDYIDFRFAGRAEADGYCSIYPDAGLAIPAEQGQDWTMSCHLRRVGGSFDDVAALNLYLDEYGPGGDYVDGQPYALRPPTDDGIDVQRVCVTHRIRTVGARNMTGYVQMKVAAGASVDVTLRVAGFQIEEGSWASDLLLPPEGTLGPTARDAGSDAAQAA